jgi:hypothetical protein
VSDDICVAEVQEWADGLQEIRELIGGRFARSEPRENAVAYLKGLLGRGAEELLDALGAGRAGDPGPDAAAALDHGLGPGRTP